MKKIILVEDDAEITDVFTIALDASRYELVSYTDGDDILTGRAKSPDLFILDRNISGTNGLDLCRFIKATTGYKHVPVLMLSAAPDIESQAASAGADGAIEKPFSLKQLRSKIAEYTADH